MSSDWFGSVRVISLNVAKVFSESVNEIRFEAVSLTTALAVNRHLLFPGCR